MTPLPIAIAAAVASFVLLVIVFELIRSRRLRERYALLWLLTGLVMLALSLWRGGLNTVAGWAGVALVPGRAALGELLVGSAWLAGAALGRASLGRAAITPAAGIVVFVAVARHE